jgi:hypothetical protein
MQINSYEWNLFFFVRKDFMCAAVTVIFGAYSSVRVSSESDGVERHSNT